jgi:hypothetical protein
MPSRASLAYAQSMKANRMEKGLTFGKLIVTVYSACGKRRARGILRLALLAHLVVFRGRNRYVIF